MLLNLPVFAPEVPAVIDFTPVGTNHLRLVLAMSRLGMISDDDLVALDGMGMETSAIRDLIEKGWQREIGGDYSFRVISAFARLILPAPGFDEEEFTSPEGKPLVGIAINSGTPEWILSGKAFTAIESLQTGLGRKALAILEGSLCHFGEPHTAGGAFSMAQYLYWYGEDDESTALEEYGDEAEEADIPRRADLFDGIPEWAYVNSSDEIPMASDDDFAEAVRKYANHPVGKLLAALHRLDITDCDEELFAAPYQSDDVSIPNEPPIVCGWNSEEDLYRIFDDNYRQRMEGGETPPWVGSIMFAPSEEGISAALPSIRHTGLVLRALDEALYELRDLSNEL